MPTVRLHRLKGEQFFDNDLAELAAGTIEFDDAGTSSNQTVYSDSGGTTAISGGHTATLDANGRLSESIYVDTTGFKETVKDSGGVEVYSEDNIPGAVETADSGFAKQQSTVNTKTSSSTIASGDAGETFACDTSSADQTQTIPDSSVIGNGNEFTFEKTSASNVLTISADAIESSTSIKLYKLGESVTLRSDGSAYRIVGSSEYNHRIPRDWLAGLTIAIDSDGSPDTDHDINITAGEARSDDDTADLFLFSEITKQIDATWAAGDDQGGLDTGAVGASTEYFIFLIKNLTTGITDVLFSASSTSPTMPSGYTVKKLIGAFITDGSSNLASTAHVNRYLPITTLTEVSTTSGTSFDVTGIPSWARVVTIIFNGVSLDGTEHILVQIGDSGGIEATGYISTAFTTTNSADTTGFIVRMNAADKTAYGTMELRRVANGLTWISTHIVRTDTSTVSYGGGVKTLSGTLDRVRLIDTGSNNFDAGAFSVQYQ